MPTILHIGSDKTGTTAIQHELAANRVALHTAGFDYPDIDGRPDHRALLTKPERFRAGETNHTVILSFEGFWAAGPERLEPLLERLPGPVSVLAWARSPQRYVDAAFRQQCRRATSTRQLSTLLRLVNLPSAINPVARRGARRYQQIIPWAEQLGDALTVRSYEPDAGDIVGAFIREAKLPNLQVTEQRKNVSPSITGLFALALQRERVAGINPHRFLEAATAAGDVNDGFFTPLKVRRWCWEHAADACAAIGLHFEWENEPARTTAPSQAEAETLLAKIAHQDPDALLAPSEA